MNICKTHLVTYLFIITTFSGCGRLVTWTNKTFYQGEPVQACTNTVSNYMRSLYMYDQFSTVCIFDALWLSEAVRQTYACVHAVKTGKGEEFRNNFLRRQLKENEHFIMFYLVSGDGKLAEKDPTWSLFLQVEGKDYTPVSIKVIELNPEYTLFFGSRYTIFKTAYEVKFSALTKEEKPILDAHVRQMALYVRSLKREAKLVWDIPVGRA